eukprot:gb/GFBE01020344.1/.p1 GENE.gb/GFBE01020344.1/~~gb/GFBE01020344.1/.p1  ORF type:complete len:218 (+),score=20.77 gb/GFBE01020344.1/:1-654(+)
MTVLAMPLVPGRVVREPAQKDGTCTPSTEDEDPTPVAYDHLASASPECHFTPPSSSIRGRSMQRKNCSDDVECHSPSLWGSEPWARLRTPSPEFLYRPCTPSYGHSPTSLPGLELPAVKPILMLATCLPCEAPVPSTQQEPAVELPCGVPSLGSLGHPHSCGDACKYVLKGRGCKDGEQCERCHLCRWKNPKDVPATAAHRFHRGAQKSRHAKGTRQ